jgi:hypothetical protein
MSDPNFDGPPGPTVSTQEELEAALLQGLASGPATEVTPEVWEAIRREVAQRLAAKRRAQS